MARLLVGIVIGFSLGLGTMIAVPTSIFTLTASAAPLASVTIDQTTIGRIKADQTKSNLAELSTELRGYGKSLVAANESTFSSLLTTIINELQITEPESAQQALSKLIATITISSRQELISVTPSDEMADIHNLVIGAANDCSLAAQYFASGMQTEQSQYTLIGVELINRCANQVAEATDQMLMHEVSYLQTTYPQNVQEIADEGEEIQAQGIPELLKIPGRR